MENAALPLLNLVILGAFMLMGLRELGNASRAAVRVENDRVER